MTMNYKYMSINVRKDLIKLLTGSNFGHYFKNVKPIEEADHTRSVECEFIFSVTSDARMLLNLIDEFREKSNYLVCFKYQKGIMNFH